MNIPDFYDAHVSYRQDQLLRDAEAARLARQVRTAVRLRAAAEARPNRGLRIGWLLRMRILIGRPAER